MSVRQTATKAAIHRDQKSVAKICNSLCKVRFSCCAALHYNCLLTINVSTIVVSPETKIRALSVLHVLQKCARAREIFHQESSDAPVVCSFNAPLGSDVVNFQSSSWLPGAVDGWA